MAILNKKDPRILIIMLRRIGDILLTTPVAREIKKELEEAKLCFLVEDGFVDVISLNPYIDEIMVLKKNLFLEYHLIRKIRKENFDIVFDFQSNPRSALFTLLSGAKYSFGYCYSFRLRNSFYFETLKADSKPRYAVEQKFNLLRLAGFSPKDITTSFYFSEDDKKFIDKFLINSGLKGKKFAIFSTTSRKSSHRWLPEYFALLAKEIYVKTGITPVFIYGPGEQEYVQGIYMQCKDVAVMLPEFTLKQAGAILKDACLLVGIDNGLRHLAIAVGTPTFAIFGPSQPEHWTPPEPKHAFVRSDVDCIECYKRECVDLTCMKVLTPEIVLNNLLNFIYKEVNIRIT